MTTASCPECSEIDGVRSAAPKGATHVEIGSGRNHARISGSQFVGGRLRLSGGFGADSTLLYSDCVERAVDSAKPEPGGGALIADTLVIG